ncbi:MAG: sugar phosphate isomerase/epimerase [Clostridia bacterium]|nr:sugar phosphate isomerase/epimerase [Clostridia bacterium]
MKLSVFYCHVQKAALESGKSEKEVLNNLKNHGINALDVSNDDIDNSEILSLCKETGIKIASIYDFYDWGKAEYNDCSRLLHHIDNAVLSGCPSILIVPGFLDKDTSDRMNSCENVEEFMQSCEDIEKMTEMLRRAVSFGKEKGISVTLEDFDNETSPCSRIYCLLWFFKNVDGLKFTLDTGNFLYNKENTPDAYDVLKNYTVHVHCKDRPYDRSVSCVAGEGVMSLAPVINDLKNSGYDGYFSIEQFGLDNMEECILRSAKNLLSM